VVRSATAPAESNGKGPRSSLRKFCCPGISSSALFRAASWVGVADESKVR
jgi:hypothetical protein